MCLVHYDLRSLKASNGHWATPLAATIGALREGPSKPLSRASRLPLCAFHVPEPVIEGWYIPSHAKHLLQTCLM